MKSIEILFISFWVGFVSDVVLNQMSRKSDIRKSNSIMRSLKPYFDKHGPFVAGVYAGITTLVFVYASWLTTLYISSLKLKLFEYTIIPKEITQFSIITYSVILYLYGFVGDILIDELKLFGNSLDDYYKTAGRGHFGGLAILFAGVLTLFVGKFLKITLNNKH